MSADFAERMHRAVYKKSGRANARGNDNPDFKAGYAAGMTGAPAEHMIESQWILRDRPSTGKPLESFREWKRGMWAAVMQKTVAKAKSR